MSTLLIQLSAEHATAGTQYHYIVSDDGQRSSSDGLASLSLLPTTGRASQVTAVIPAAQLSWHAITLPPGLNVQSRRQQTRIRAVLDGLLEEKLLDDPAQLEAALMLAEQLDEKKKAIPKEFALHVVECLRAANKTVRDGECR